MLNAVEADRRENKPTASANLEYGIRHASLLVDAVAAVGAVGKLSAVAEQTTKQEKALWALKEKV